MPRLRTTRQSRGRAQSVNARRIARPRSALSKRSKTKPVARSSAMSSSVQSVTVSASPPVRRTSGRLP